MTILCYHSVDPHWEHQLAVHPDGFAEHCAWVARRRQVVDLRAAAPRIDRRGRLPHGTAALTFDDGFAELYEHALPVLRALRLPATVFLVAQTLTPGGQAVDWVDDTGGAALRTLTLDQVLEMRDEGIEFQSHSYAHRNLPDLGFAECVADLRESRELLADLLGRPVDLLAYPRGLHDEKVRAAAARAGYSHGFALPVTPEEPDAYAVPRVGIYRGNSTTTVRVKSCRPYLRVRTDPRAAGAHQRVRGVVRALRL